MTQTTQKILSLAAITLGVMSIFQMSATPVVAQGCTTGSYGQTICPPSPSPTPSPTPICTVGNYGQVTCVPAQVVKRPGQDKTHTPTNTALDASSLAALTGIMATGLGAWVVQRKL